MELQILNNDEVESFDINDEIYQYQVYAKQTTAQTAINGQIELRILTINPSFEYKQLFYQLFGKYYNKNITRILLKNGDELIFDNEQLNLDYFSISIIDENTNEQMSNNLLNITNGLSFEFNYK